MNETESSQVDELMCEWMQLKYIILFNLNYVSDDGQLCE